MSRPKKPKTHADHLAKLSAAPRKDFDPEEDAIAFSDSSSGSDSEQSDHFTGREHYDLSGKSKLRKHDLNLGKQYEGAEVSRKGALDLDSDRESDHDSDDDQDDDSDISVDGHEVLDESEASEEGGEEEEDVSDGGSEDFGTGDTSMSEAEEDVSIKAPTDEDRAQLRRLMNEEQKAVAASMAQANQADAEKGDAVKRQRQTFDAFLNGRIRLQQGLVAINSVQAKKEDDISAHSSTALDAAETAAIRLWNNLAAFRGQLQRSSTGKKRKHHEISTESSLAQIWETMESDEAAALPNRRATLLKWSAKTRGVSTQPISKRLDNTAHQTSVLDVIQDQMSNVDRLVKRTRIPRSCAPLQVTRRIKEAPDIFDDADFYGVMLKELLEQRSIEAASNVQLDQVAQHWQATRDAKTKKNVDTKASKGRKLRYTVHEKLQNFMAPEDRNTWGERQIEELFGSLLGKSLVLRENAEAQDDGDDDGREEEALLLFRN